MNERKTFIKCQGVLSLKKTLSAVLLTDSYGGQALFVPDVDYLGDPHSTGCNPKKQEEEESFASVCQASMHNSNNSERS